MKVILSASLACANPICIRQDVEILEETAISAYHFDICDGIFAPTFLLNESIVKTLRPLSKKRFDVHLYCHYPSRYLGMFRDSGTDIVVVHVESEGDRYLDVIRQVRRLGMKAGVAILPTSRIPQDIDEALDDVSLVVLNMVGPAYASQPFNPRGVQNMEDLRQLLSRRGQKGIEIAADGSINNERLPGLISAGCNHLICGTASIFKPGTNVAQNVVEFSREVERAITAQEKEYY